MYWHSASLPDHKKYIVSFISPCPSIGKSTISRALSRLLNAAWVNQDECGGKRLYLTKIKSSLSTKTLVIADKTNAMTNNRNELRTFNADLVWIHMTVQSATPQQDIKKLAIERLRGRGSHHKSLVASPQSEGVIESFITNFEAPTKEEEAERMINVDINLTPLDMITVILNKLYEYQVIQEIPSIEHIESAISASMSYERQL